MDTLECCEEVDTMTEMVRTPIEQFWKDIEELRQRKIREELDRAQVQKVVEEKPAAGEHTSWCRILQPGQACNCPRKDA
jgi:hypothetical protein